MADIPSPAQPGHLRWTIIGVVLLVLIGLVLFLLYAPAYLHGSYLSLLGYAMAALFFIVGLIELAYELGQHHARDTEAIVPAFFILIAIGLGVLTYLDGTFGIPGIDLATQIGAMLLLLIVGSVLFAVLDHYDGLTARIAAVGPTRNGGEPTQTVVKVYGYSRVLAGIEVVAVFVILYLAYQAYIYLTSHASCAFLFCGLMVLDPDVRMRLARMVGW